MVPLLNAFLFFVFVALAHLTLRTVIGHLRDRSADRFSQGTLELLRFFQYFVSCLGVATFCVAFPSPVAGLLVIAFATVMTTFYSARRAAELQGLSELIRFVCDQNGSLPDSIEGFAHSCKSEVSWRGKTFAYLLRCGHLPAKAAKAANLRLEIDALAAIPMSGNLVTNRNEPGQHSSLPEIGRGKESRLSTNLLRPMSPHNDMQTAYLIGIVFVAIAVGMFNNSFIVPVLESMLDEFLGHNSPQWVKIEWCFDMIEMISSVVIWAAVLILAWSLLVIVFQFQWMLRITPWLGNTFVSRQRRRSLRALGSAMLRSVPLNETLDLMTQSSPSRWLRRRSRKASRRIDQGESIVASLVGSGWVTNNQAAWLKAADDNEHLPHALIGLAHEIDRRLVLRQQIRFAWLFPSVIISVSLFVGLQGYGIFLALTELINVLG